LKNLNLTLNYLFSFFKIILLFFFLFPQNLDLTSATPAESTTATPYPTGLPVVEFPESKFLKLFILFYFIL